MLRAKRRRVIVATVVVVWGLAVCLSYLLISNHRLNGLMADLGSSDSKVQAAAIDKLARMRSIRVIRRLIDVVGNSDSQQLSSAAERVLDEIGAPAVAPLVHELHYEPPAWLPRILRSRVNRDNSRIEMALVQILFSLREREVDALLPLLVDRNPRIRSFAAREMPRVERAVAPLVRVLADRDADARRAAAETLGYTALVAKQDEQIDCSATIEPLTRVLKDADSKVGAAAADALGYIGSANAAPALIAAARDGQNDVKVRAILALGKIGGDSVRTSLVSLLEDQEAFKRAAAASALGGIACSRSPEPLLMALSDSDAGVVMMAAKALGALKEHRAVDPLIALLGSVNGPTRAYAAEALGLIADPRACKALRARLNDDYWWAAQQAATSLGLLGDKDAAEPLIALLREREEYGRTAPRGDIGFVDIGRVPDDSTSDEGGGRITAQVGDGMWFFDVTYPGLTRPVDSFLYEGFEPVAEAAAEALGRLRDPRAVDVLVEVLKDQPNGVQNNAIRALGRIGDARAIVPLKAILDDPESIHYRAILFSLELIGGDDTRKIVDKYLGPRVDLAAIARDYINAILEGDYRNQRLLLHALWRHGGYEMAENMYWCQRPWRETIEDWARRHNCLDRLLESKDSPDRPKWGRKISGLK
jgi:HEAT repeat protein